MKLSMPKWDVAWEEKSDEEVFTAAELAKLISVFGSRGRSSSPDP